VYVFKPKAFGGAGAVKRIVVKHPIGSTRPTLGEPKAGWRKLELDDQKIYLVDRGEPLRRAQAIAGAGAER
jgi:hypothetical protein